MRRPFAAAPNTPYTIPSSISDTTEPARGSPRHARPTAQARRAQRPLSTGFLPGICGTPAERPGSRRRTDTRSLRPGAATRGRNWPSSAGWGTSQTLKVTLVRPELVVEVRVDVARDSAGRWRRHARLHRARPDLQPTDAPRLPSLR